MEFTRRGAIGFIACLFLFWATPSAPAPNGSDPVQTQKAYHEGIALVQQRHLDEAIQAFERGLQSDPGNLVLLDAIGATYALQGDFQKGRAYFIRDLEIDPGFAPARKNMAIGYFSLGKYDLAVPQFEFLTQDPKSQAVAYLFLGIIAQKQKQYEKSVSLLQKSGELAYQYPQAVLSLARSLDETHQPERGQAVLNRLEGISGVSAPEHFQAGLLYLQHRQYSNALDHFEKVRQTHHEYPGLEYQRALVLEKMGRSKEALRVLLDLTKVKPHAEALNLLAHVAREAGDLNLAIQSLRKAAELEPAKEDNYLDFSALCLDHESYSLAAEIADVGLAHIPRSYRLLVQKGAALDKLGRRDEAAEAFRTAMGLREDNSEALISLAITQARGRQFQEAIETLNSGTVRFPENYYLFYYLGNVLVQLRERQGTSPDREITEKAKLALKRAIQLNPAFADSYFKLSKLYITDNPRIAEQKLMACLRLNPKHASAKYELGRLLIHTGRRSEGQRLLDEFIIEQQTEKLNQENKPQIDIVQR